ncbi:hypothetical protein [Mycobacteroides abscessus]|uniref:hypothetical protein n=1 Tax=Mycobacteroides abscessus TaxID=36809 RepID=UPI0009275606|nr:hypothetical protein [Mycobacteroides abscessus]SIL63498.1 Uncharacterised protein [Mycobacteroides abscessus subsp. abscessus]
MSEQDLAGIITLIVLLVLFVIVPVVEDWLDSRPRKSVIADRLAMRALAQHSKLMNGEPGAEYGNYQPVDLDSDEVLRHSTITLPDEVDIESHWAAKSLRNAAVAVELRKRSKTMKESSKKFDWGDNDQVRKLHYLSQSAHYARLASEVEELGLDTVLARLRRELDGIGGWDGRMYTSRAALAEQVSVLSGEPIA